MDADAEALTCRSAHERCIGNGTLDPGRRVGAVVLDAVVEAAAVAGSPRDKCAFYNGPECS